VQHLLYLSLANRTLPETKEYKMEKMNIKKHINLLMIALAGTLMYSCSGEETIPIVETPGQHTSLSVLLNANPQGKEKSTGNQDKNAESKIYSLEVLIFKSTGEREAGQLDGYGYVVRKTKDVSGKPYDKEYIETDEIRNIELTAGKRDIYVIANAPDKYFSTVTNIQGFLEKFENLYTQGRYPHPGGTKPNPDEELPIGGLNPSDLKTNLTMCNYIKDVTFSKVAKNHYLGYTDNNGRPGGTDPNDGELLDGKNPFLIERLVARVAIQKIDFQLPAVLPFEGSTYTSNDYTYHIDSVFMMNVKTTSKFAAGAQLAFTEKFGHGCDVGYTFLKNQNIIKNLHPQSQYTEYLAEAISTPNYNIEVNATPLWFYSFENIDSNYPPYFVIGVRYNFKSSKDNTDKTVKSYYAVEVNPPKAGKPADHNYIKRNNQYGISATIKGLGAWYGNNPVPLKSVQNTDQDIEVTEIVGKDLFPWTGDVYNLNNE